MATSNIISTSSSSCSRLYRSTIISYSICSLIFFLSVFPSVSGACLSSRSAPEGKNESLLDKSVFDFSLIDSCIFNWVGFSCSGSSCSGIACSGKSKTGSSKTGFSRLGGVPAFSEVSGSDSSEAAERTGFSRIVYSISVRCPSSFLSRLRWTYPAFSSSLPVEQMLSTPSLQMQASPLVV